MIEVMSVPIIVTLVYMVIEVYKMIFKSKPVAMKFIPAIAGVIGGAVGVIAFFVVPEMILGAEVITAFITGMFSGLSATGVNQIFKQLKSTTDQPSDDIKEPNDDEKTQ